jgi:acetylornithine deacetylase/succinyl-diaminopimelate desuccinylase-like protein
VNKEKVFANIEDGIDRTVQDIVRFIQQPSIVSNPDELKLCAAQVKDYLRDFGCSRSELIQTPGSPIVYAEYNAHSDVTLAVYGWYDTDKLLDGWSVPPLEGRLVDLPDLGKAVVGRGAFTKGLIPAFTKAMEALRNASCELPVNLKFVIEGDENLSSPQIPYFIEHHGDLLRGTKGLLFPRVAQDKTGKVVLKLGGKGMLRLEFTCSGELWGRGPTKFDIHGSEKAWVDSPMWRLIKALSTMVSDDGNTITIEGFYDGIKKPSKADMSLVDSLSKTIDIDSYKKELGVNHFIDDLKGRELMEKYLFSPTFNLSTIDSGPGGVVLPHKATAKVEVRFVPEQTVDGIVSKIKNHLFKKGYPDVKVVTKGSIDWSKVDLNASIVRAVLATYHGFQAPYEIWPNDVRSPPHGAFTTKLGIPFCDGGLGHGGRHHSPDEYILVKSSSKTGDLVLAQKSYVTIVEKFAEMTRMN